MKKPGKSGNPCLKRSGIPRYLEGADISRMFLLLGELSQVEAEVMALQWNALEADRVGLPEDAVPSVRGWEPIRNR